MKTISRSGSARIRVLTAARHSAWRRFGWRQGLVLLAAGLVMSVLATGPAAAAPVGKRVDSDYTLLRSAPASWVIGTAYRDWSLSDEGATSGYAWARIGGDLHHCMWISEKATTTRKGRLVSGACGAPRQYTGDEFRRLFTNGMIGSNKAGNDGAPVLLRPKGDCVITNGKIDGWGNVKPWQTTSDPSRRLRGALTVGKDGASTSHGDLVKWRYVTRDGKYVMIHASRYGKTDGKGAQGWFFVQRSCLSI